MTHGYSTRAQRFARDSVWNRTFLFKPATGYAGERICELWSSKCRRSASKALARRAFSLVIKCDLTFVPRRAWRPWYNPPKACLLKRSPRQRDVISISGLRTFGGINWPGAARRLALTFGAVVDTARRRRDSSVWPQRARRTDIALRTLKSERSGGSRMRSHDVFSDRRIIKFLFTMSFSCRNIISN
jgi:hypothetical protein